MCVILQFLDGSSLLSNSLHVVTNSSIYHVSSRSRQKSATNTFYQLNVTRVHERLLRPYLRYRSSAAPAVRRLSSTARTGTPPFNVRSSGLFCGPPDGLEFVTRLPSKIRRLLLTCRDLKTLLFSFYYITRYWAKPSSTLCSNDAYHYADGWQQTAWRTA